MQGRAARPEGGETGAGHEPRGRRQAHLAVVAGDAADDAAEHDGDPHRHEADGERDERALQHPGEDVTPQFVGNPDLARKRYALARDAVALLPASPRTRLVVGWHVPHEQIPDYMAACDALVFTSAQEGSPNAVKEALACNLPVVSVPVGDVAERLNGIEGCELCADDRPETIAAALERVLARGERVASREAVSHLDERLITQRVIAIYNGALNGRPRA